MKFLSLVLAMTFSIASFAATTAKTMTGPSQLDDLIRGEMAAVKTYNIVLENVKNETEVKSLTAMKKDHVNAVETLKRYATAEVKEDTTSAGAWGAFAKAWTKGATLFSDKTALRALTQGEEHGVREYNEALKDENVSADVKKIIKSTLLPRQEEHVKTLQTFLK